MFACVNEVQYEMRWNKIIRPAVKLMVYGVSRFGGWGWGGGGVGARLLNDPLKQFPEICDLQTEFSGYDMDNPIKCWKGAMADDKFAYVSSREMQWWIDLYVLTLLTVWGFLLTFNDSYTSFYSK